MSKLFYSITPERVLQSLEEFDFHPTGHYLALNSFENRVYDIKLEDGEHLIIKFYRPGRWSKNQIQEEHDFLLELKANDIPVCAPMVLNDGQTIHSAEEVYFAIWPRTGGRSADEFSDEQVQILGRLVARIHNVGDSKISSERICLDSDSYGRLPLKFLLDNQIIPETARNRYQTAVYNISEIYETLAKEIPAHRIHGDCHTGNLLYGDQGWFFLDFDDFLTGPPVQDIWMFFSSRDENGIRQRNLFLDAYRHFRDFHPSWLSLIEPLRALRYIHYAAWIARRWDDPIFPVSFPQFGTESYWEECVTDLEDQLKTIYRSLDKNQGSVFSVPSEYEEEAPLTNEDYFWDLKEDS
ncbi:MAG: serine/threonine protein kinase [Spirochaetia bacterium]|nr:serine/threonine protein kinase [Spirochaetia bacterium]